MVTQLDRILRQRTDLEQRLARLTTQEARAVVALNKTLSSSGIVLTLNGGIGPDPDVPRRGPGRPRTTAAAAPPQRRLKRKTIKCPKCVRMFAHPLPLSRHLVATHGFKKKKTT